MCQIRKITMDSITKTQFGQIVSAEETCYTNPYTPEILQERIRDLSAFACFNGENIIGFLTVNMDSLLNDVTFFI